MRGKNNVFMSESGKVLVMDPDLIDNAHVFSPDGTTHYVVYGEADYVKNNGGTIEESGNFSIPALSLSGRFEREGDTLTWLDETYTKTDLVYNRSAVKLVPLPDTRQPEYLSFSEDGSVVIYVSASFYKYSYESFRFFIGDGKTMREVNIQCTTRYRNGGTTYITTDEGTFYSPAVEYNASTRRFDPQPCTWNEEHTQNEVVLTGRVKRSEIMDLYDIIEDETGRVTSVTKK